MTSTGTMLVQGPEGIQNRDVRSQHATNAEGRAVRGDQLSACSTVHSWTTTASSVKKNVGAGLTPMHQRM